MSNMKNEEGLTETGSLNGTPTNKRRKLTNSNGTEDLTQPPVRAKRAKRKKGNPKSKVVTGYIIYASEIRKEVVKKNPDREFGEISKLVGIEWRNLPDDIKSEYDERAMKANKKAKADFNESMTALSNANNQQQVPLAQQQQLEQQQQQQLPSFQITLPHQQAQQWPQMQYVVATPPTASMQHQHAQQQQFTYSSTPNGLIQPQHPQPQGAYGAAPNIMVQHQAVYLTGPNMLMQQQQHQSPYSLAPNVMLHQQYQQSPYPMEPSALMQHQQHSYPPMPNVMVQQPPYQPHYQMQPNDTDDVISPPPAPQSLPSQQVQSQQQQLAQTQPQQQTPPTHVTSTTPCHNPNCQNNSTTVQYKKNNIVYRKPATIKLLPKDATIQTEPIKWAKTSPKNSKQPLKFSEKFIGHILTNYSASPKDQETSDNKLKETDNDNDKTTTTTS